MPNWGGGSAGSGDAPEGAEVNTTPEPEAEQAEEQAATVEPTVSRGIPDPSEPSG
ncbi:hypothetical protein [Streptacidiphilus fuscans]|uniref:Uncharacterized protein n=1 Tax=Streptacidiphilus fuscans TaxID=2789292 RepID=A0A931B6E7_9ACTN|nr:hypothetical protein [Streptacidiphilus fuscans]MBF9069492.1 hypothetical protein [Streptacidiphilus fuscans]